VQFRHVPPSNTNADPTIAEDIKYLLSSQIQAISRINHGTTSGGDI
jgi:hypothetical protein